MNSTKINTWEARRITKHFPGVLANDHINIDFHSGEIHAILGENGAGKSTLMKILYGIYQPDDGEILVDGQPVILSSPTDSIRYGIGMVHQHFMLVRTFSVAENIALGLNLERRFLLDLDTIAGKLNSLAETYHMQVDPYTKIWQLSVGEEQRVEILKALYLGASLLILDEPTSVLTPQEIEHLFLVLRKMADEGHAIVFISHKIHEVLDLSQRITVLRRGKVVKTLQTSEATQSELARLMVGRDIDLQVSVPDLTPGDTRLCLEEVWAHDESGNPVLRGIDLNIRAGEIFGIAGVAGNGQRALAEVIAGVRKPTKGRILIDRTEVTGWNPDKLHEIGFSYIPESRIVDGTVGDFSVEENLLLKEMTYAPYSKGIFLNFQQISRQSSTLIKDFDIRTPSAQTPVKYLSGGNIQKLILAREISSRPTVMVAAEPTRGLDIGATEYVRGRLVEQRSAGTSTLLISEDLDEIINLSDRIGVIFKGEIIGIVDRGQADIEQIGLMMGGVRSPSPLK
jgi:simple sugar transport system ATP-binding protein